MAKTSGSLRGGATKNDRFGGNSLDRIKKGDVYVNGVRDVRIQALRDNKYSVSSVFVDGAKRVTDETEVKAYLSYINDKKTSGENAVKRARVDAITERTIDAYKSATIEEQKGLLRGLKNTYRDAYVNGRNLTDENMLASAKFFNWVDRQK